MNRSMNTVGLVGQLGKLLGTGTWYQVPGTVVRPTRPTSRLRLQSTLYDIIK